MSTDGNGEREYTFTCKCGREYCISYEVLAFHDIINKCSCGTTLLLVNNGWSEEDELLSISCTEVSEEEELKLMDRVVFIAHGSQEE